MTNLFSYMGTVHFHPSRHITLCHTLAELAKVPEPKVHVHVMYGHV